MTDVNLAQKVQAAYDTIHAARWTQDGHTLGEIDEDMARKHVRVLTDRERSAALQQRAQEVADNGTPEDRALMNALRRAFSPEANHLEVVELFDAITDYVEVRLFESGAGA